MSCPNCCTRDGAVIDHAAAEGEHHAGDDQQRRPHQPVEDDEGEGGLDRKVLHRNAEHERAVHVQVAGDRLEVDPAPDQRERDRRREQAAPHDQPVREPAEPAAPEDVRVGGKLAPARGDPD